MKHVYSISKAVFTALVLLCTISLNAQNPTTVSASNACNVVEDFDTDDGGFSSSSIYSDANDASFNYVLASGAWIESSGLALRNASLISGIYLNEQLTGQAIVGFRYQAPVGTEYRIRVINSACNCVGGPEVIASTANGPVWTPLGGTSGTVCVNMNDLDIVKGQNIRYEVSFRSTLPGNIVFDDFSLGETSASPLPVTFRGFTARKESNVINLLWDVAEEQDVAGYDIEKSSNGIEFKAIGTVAAHGKPNYRFTDANANGVNFYRIKSKDIDGQFKYSGIIKITSSQKTSLRLFPLPAQSTVNVQHDKMNANGRIILTTTDGRAIKQIIPSNGSFQTSIDLTGVTPGMYIVRVDNGNGIVESVKLIKQ